MKTLEEKRAYNAAYYLKNREKLLARETERSRKRYAANKGKKLATNRAWVQKNSERHKALCARWERENAAKRVQNRKAWYAANKQHVFIKVNRRRARLLQLGGATQSSHRDYPKDFIAILFAKQRGLCPVCRAQLKIKGRHIDHVISLAAGGGNDPSNLQLLCPPCNLSKGTKDPVLFMQSRGFLL